MAFMRRFGNKFGNKTIKENGRTYNSGFERNFFVSYLNPLELAGDLVGVQHHMRVLLLATPLGDIKLETDYTAWCTKLKEQVYWEVKGFPTPEWNLKKKIWSLYGPGRLYVVTGTSKSWKISEEIFPDPKWIPKINFPKRKQGEKL